MIAISGGIDSFEERTCIANMVGSHEKTLTTGG